MTLTTTAFASEAEDLAAGVKCKPAKDIIKAITKMNSLKPDQTDTVAASPKMKITPEDGNNLPNRLYVRYGEKETDLPISDDGRVVGMNVVAGLNKKSEFCVQDPMLVNAKDGEMSLNASMDFDISFKNKSGTHEIAEIRDGLDDGRAHIKKLVPAPFRAMIPKFDHVLIEYLDESGEAKDIAPQISAYRGEQRLDGLILERLENMHFVKIDQLEEIGGDRLRIAKKC